MALFKNNGRTSPVVNNSQNMVAPNVSLTEDVNYPAAMDANTAATRAKLDAAAAKAEAEDAKESADSAASSASQAASAASTAVSYADGWEEAYSEAQEAVDEAKSAVRAADVVYYGFINMKAEAESVPADQPADATWNASTNTMSFDIPRGLDGTIEGLADAPVIETVDDEDYILVVDSDTDAVSKATIDDFLNLTVKSVNGYTPDANGNVTVPDSDTSPVLYLGETIIGSFESAPQGAVPADGKQYNVVDFPDVWAKIQDGSLASVSDQDWLAGKNDVFSKGDGANWFRVPKLNDNGDVVTTNGDYTFTGNIAFTAGTKIPVINGSTVHNGDLIVQDTSRSVGIDTYIVNRMASEGSGNDYAAVGFIDRRDNDKVIGGMFVDEDTNTVGLLANEGDLDLASQTGNVHLVPTNGTVLSEGTVVLASGHSFAGTDSTGAASPLIYKSVDSDSTIIGDGVNPTVILADATVKGSVETTDPVVHHGLVLDHDATATSALITIKDTSNADFAQAYIGYAAAGSEDLIFQNNLGARSSIDCSSDGSITLQTGSTNPSVNINGYLNTTQNIDTVASVNAGYLQVNRTTAGASITMQGYQGGANYLLSTDIDTSGKGSNQWYLGKGSATDDGFTWYNYLGNNGIVLKDDGHIQLTPNHSSYHVTVGDTPKNIEGVLQAVVNQNYGIGMVSVNDLVTASGSTATGGAIISSNSDQGWEMRMYPVGVTGSSNFSGVINIATADNTTQTAYDFGLDGIIRIPKGIEITSIIQGEISDTASPANTTSVFNCTGLTDYVATTGSHYNIIGGYDGGWGWSGVEKIPGPGVDYKIGFMMKVGDTTDFSRYTAYLCGDGKFYVNNTALTSVLDVEEAVEAVHAEYRPIIEELKAELAALKEKING